MKRIDFRPPPAIIAAARRGLDLYSRGFGGSGLRPETIAWARKVAKGQPIDAAKAVKGRAWHRRHAVDFRPGWQGRSKKIDGREVWSERPTPGYVANLLWFGSAGRVWFERVCRDMGR